MDHTCAGRERVVVVNKINNFKAHNARKNIVFIYSYFPQSNHVH